MTPEKLFLYFLVKPGGGQNFYVDDAGIVKTINMASGQPTWLKKSPEGWFDMTLAFARNTRYYGINRSFTVPLKFVDDGAHIIRTLFYSGKGIEQQIELDVLKLNGDTGIYELYYKGILDLTQMEDLTNEGVVVGVMQGGVVQLLKAYENTIFQIPCDGSIPENIKVNIDGTLFDDVFHYNMVPLVFPKVPHNDNLLLEAFALPMFFTSNDGDAIGVVHGDPSFLDIGQFFLTTINNYLATSGNWAFYAEEQIDLTISGKITVKAITDSAPASFSLRAAVSNGYLTTGALPVLTSGAGQVWAQTFNFKKTITIPAGNKLFFIFEVAELATFTLVSGSMDLSFSSKYKASSVWGITLYDAFKILVKQINQLSSNAEITYDFDADSQLLQQYLNLVITSGDALRASTDPDYQKFFNPTIATGQNINQFFSYGPVIKTSLVDLFDSANAILNACLSNQFLSTATKESLFLESKGYVFNPTEVNGEFLDLGEVAELKIGIATDWYWNILKIGYPSQNYDEKAGKFEYNTTAAHTAPIKSIAKELNLISKYRADSYGIEYTRYNTSRQSKSTTYNESDNSVFILNRSISSFAYDFFQANDVPDSGGNANQLLLVNRLEQAVPTPYLTGTFMSYREDGSIYVINQPLVADTLSTLVFINGTLFGNPTDKVVFTLWQNGVAVNQQTIFATSAATIFAANLTIVLVYNEGDAIYVTAETSATGSVTITSASIEIVVYARMENTGNISIPAGILAQLLTLDTVTDLRGSPGPYLPVSFGFPYFFFNEVLNSPNFNLVFSPSGTIIGSGNLVLKVYVNGAVRLTYTFAATGTLSSWALSQSFNLNFSYGDVVFILASTDAGVTATINYGFFEIVSTQILVYDLKRVAYDASRGLPHIETNFNLEDLTPGRMLLKNGNFLHGALAQLNTETLVFNKLDKNQFLSTTAGGITITENAPVAIGAMATPLFIPILFEFRTMVPLTFEQLLSYAANAHIRFTWNGIAYWGFPIEVSQKPELNESQNWKLLCSPVNDLGKLIDLDYTGLNQLFS